MSKIAIMSGLQQPMKRQKPREGRKTFLVGGNSHSPHIRAKKATAGLVEMLTSISSSKSTRKDKPSNKLDWHSSVRGSTLPLVSGDLTIKDSLRQVAKSLLGREVTRPAVELPGETPSLLLQAEVSRMPWKQKFNIDRQWKQVQGQQFH